MFNPSTASMLIDTKEPVMLVTLSGENRSEPKKLIWHKYQLIHSYLPKAKDCLANLGMSKKNHYNHSRKYFAYYAFKFLISIYISIITLRKRPTLLAREYLVDAEINKKCMCSSQRRHL